MGPSVSQLRLLQSSTTNQVGQSTQHRLRDGIEHQRGRTRLHTEISKYTHTLIYVHMLSIGDIDTIHSVQSHSIFFSR